ncbi:MAG: bifunctional diguanylate cyclase/phosphodiesterase [Vicinamibacteria bacterium]|nr:bifunctional diguanylate cyclase/phosphodiesterase [Vicinamibacteria bacterium]
MDTALDEASSTAAHDFGRGRHAGADPASTLGRSLALGLGLLGAALNLLGASQGGGAALGAGAALVALRGAGRVDGLAAAALTLVGLAPAGASILLGHAVELVAVAGLAIVSHGLILAALVAWAVGLALSAAVGSAQPWYGPAVIGIGSAVAAEAVLTGWQARRGGLRDEPTWARGLRLNLLAVEGPLVALCGVALAVDAGVGIGLAAMLLAGAGLAAAGPLAAQAPGDAVAEASPLHDEATGLPNRRQLETRLRQWIERGPSEPFALLHLGIERLRSVESSFGRGAADQVRGLAAQRLEAGARAGDMVARVGDDEFAVLLRGVSERETATRLGVAMVDALGRPFALPSGEVALSARVGVGLFPGDGATADVLMRNATAATWAAQRVGGDVVRHYTSRVNSREVRRLTLEAGLRRAIEEDKIELYLQPIVDVRSGRAQGAEALVRWPAPDGSFHTPSEFIPLAEESDLILALDAWMLDAAARAIAGLGPAAEGLVISLNLSPRQLQRSGLEARVREVLEQYGVPPYRLGVEITEGTALQDFERTAETLRALRTAGIKVSIDDFGTGYSSLSYLRRLPVDAVKLDASFVREIDRGEDAAAIAAAVIAMSHGLRLQVVAEGVENEAQLRYLRSHGCDAVQGYLVSKAVPPQEFAALVTSGLSLLPGER